MKGSTMLAQTVTVDGSVYLVVPHALHYIAAGDYTRGTQVRVYNNR